MAAGILGMAAGIPPALALPASAAPTSAETTTASTEAARTGGDVQESWQAVMGRALAAWPSADTTEARLAVLDSVAPLVADHPLVLAPFVIEMERVDYRVRNRLLQMMDQARWPEAETAAKRAVLALDPDLAITAAAILGRSKLPETRDSLLAVWRQTDRPPPRVADAVVAALASAVAPADLAAMAGAPEPDIRMAALRALRLRKSARLAEFLAVPDLASEAARAIFDERIEGAMPSLIELGTRHNSPLDEDAQKRAVAAAWRTGGTRHAEAVAALLASRKVSESGGTEDTVARHAWEALIGWEAPPEIDPLVKNRPFAAHPRPAAESWEARRRHAQGLTAWVGRLGTDAQAAWGAWHAKLDAAPRSTSDFATYLQDVSVPEGERVFHLQSRLNSTPAAADVAEIARAALAVPDAPSLHSAARAWSFQRHGPGAITWLLESLANATAAEKQDGIRLLDQHRSPEAQSYLLRLLNQARHGLVDPAVVPEVVEAIERRARAEGPESRGLRAALDAWRASQPPSLGDPLRPWRPALQPGDVDSGRRLFYSNLTRCAECHEPAQPGIPPLHGLASRMDGAALLEAITLPSDPATRRDSPPRPDGGCRPMGTLLTLRELRDLLSYLRTRP